MERMISRIIDAMLAEGGIEERQRAVMTYGLDLLLCTVISLILIVIGNVLGQEIQMSASCFRSPCSRGSAEGTIAKRIFAAGR